MSVGKRRSQPENRLTTFETDADETLLVMAGRGEMEKRTIYRGPARGRYAIVPVDQLGPEKFESSSDQSLRIDDLRVLGKTVGVQKTGDRDVRLTVDGIEVAKRDAAGVYGLIWVPSD